MRVNAVNAVHSQLETKNHAVSFYVKDIPSDEICFRGKLKTTHQQPLFKRLAALFGIGVSAAAAANANKNAETVSYKDYVQKKEYNFPEGSVIVLPTGENVDLNEYANKNSFDSWVNEPEIKEIIVLDPNSTEKQLKKFIPTLERSISGGRLCIHHKGYGYEWIDLNKKNILVDEGKWQTLYDKDRIEGYVPVDAVSGGTSGNVNVDKIPYGVKIKCYTDMPRKWFMVPKGAQITIDNKVLTIEKDTLAYSINGDDGIKIASEDNIPRFLYTNKPTDSQKSESMFERIINSADENEIYAKSTLGVKFLHYIDQWNVPRYRIGNVVFEVIGNVRMERAYDYYYDKYEAKPFELDKLYAAYLAHPELKKNGGEVTLNRDKGSISVRKF